MDNITRAFLDSLGPAPLHNDSNRGLLFLHVFLYRDALPRPLRALWPASNPDGHRSDSDCPFRRVATISSVGAARNLIGHDIEFFADQPSLLTSHPLRFHALTVDFLSPDLPAYNAVGGSGTACPADDARTMRELLSALRSFPAGWHLGMDVNNPDDDKPPEGDHEHSS